MRKTTVAAACLIGILSGCATKAKDETRSAPPAAATATPAGAPDAAAAEGAMCLEHGVLEAVCTKCNPKLIPVFKAKGDWCAEHEFPESFCPVCHPEKGGRPAGDVSTDEAPADGTRIRFKTLETARQAGIQTVKAVSGSDAGAVPATARITGDPARMARVNVTAPGVIRSLNVDVGTRVGRGAPLAVIESASLAQDRSRLEAARARARAADASFQREKELHDKGISSMKDVQAAQQELETARAEVAAGEAALGMVGTDEGSSGTYTLRSPIPGIVTARHFNIGTLVDAEEILFEIIDTSKLWAEIDVPEHEAFKVSTGQPVSIQVDGLDDAVFEGTISYVAPVVDPATRTVLARAALDNPEGILRANMYARARIRKATPGTSVLIPKAALHVAKGINLVFVRLEEDEFITRRVKVGSTDGDLVAVNQGLRAGEDIVTTGSFLLKTETLKESIGAGCCDVEPPK